MKNKNEKYTYKEIDDFFHLLFLKINLDTNQAINFFSIRNKCLNSLTIPDYLL